MGVMHGGDIRAASKQYGIAESEWIDLSTGLNPKPYPVDNIPADVFSSLPYTSAKLQESAADYYKNKNLIAVNGTQLAIKKLPQILPHYPIVIPQHGYLEHSLHWHAAGVEVINYPSVNKDHAIHSINSHLNTYTKFHLLIINPNNPTGLTFSPQQIQTWANKLSDDCYLIVDEAFMDMHPGESVLKKNMSENMIVLRSFGKFFGLAGIRMGFVFANDFILRQVEKEIGLWAVNGPAQHIAMEALANERWQQSARQDIQKAVEVSQIVYSELFNPLLIIRQVHESLFSSYWLPNKQAQWIYHFFACRGILIRLINVDEKTSLIRLGLIDICNQDKLAKIKLVIKEFNQELI